MKKAVVTVLSVTVSVGLITIFQLYTAQMPVKNTLPTPGQPTTEPLQNQKGALQREQTAPLATSEQAVATLNALIAKNAPFSVQLSHPELPLKIRLWQRRGMVKLPAAIQWAIFKKDVQQFGVNLHTLLAKDAKGIYYHLEALRKDGALYRLLEQMNRKLPQPKTGVNSVALEKGQARMLVNTINLYAQAFYSHKLLSRIQTLLKQFEAQAKKLRAAEEEAQKSAEKRQPVSSYDDFDFSYEGRSYGGDSSFDESEFDFGMGDFSDEGLQTMEGMDTEPIAEFGPQEIEPLPADLELKASGLDLDWGV